MRRIVAPTCGVVVLLAAVSSAVVGGPPAAMVPSAVAEPPVAASPPAGDDYFTTGQLLRGAVTESDLPPGYVRTGGQDGAGEITAFNAGLCLPGSYGMSTDWGPITYVSRDFTRPGGSHLTVELDAVGAAAAQHIVDETAAAPGTCPTVRNGENTTAYARLPLTGLGHPAAALITTDRYADGSSQTRLSAAVAIGDLSVVLTSSDAQSGGPSSGVSSSGGSTGGGSSTASPSGASSAGTSSPGASSPGAFSTGSSRGGGDTGRFVEVVRAAVRKVEPVLGGPSVADLRLGLLTRTDVPAGFRTVMDDTVDARDFFTADGCDGKPRHFGVRGTAVRRTFAQGDAAPAIQVVVGPARGSDLAEALRTRLSPCPAVPDGYGGKRTATALPIPSTDIPVAGLVHDGVAEAVIAYRGTCTDLTVTLPGGGTDTTEAEALTNAALRRIFDVY